MRSPNDKLTFAAIRAADGIDPTVVELPNYWYVTYATASAR